MYPVLTSKEQVRQPYGQGPQLFELVKKYLSSHEMQVWSSLQSKQPVGQLMQAPSSRVDPSLHVVHSRDSVQIKQF